MRTRTLGGRRHFAPVVATVATLLAALLTSPGDFAQQRGHCAVTELPGHLVLPDGKVYQSVELKICFENWHNPSMGLHVIYLDGMKWGYLLSRSGRSDETPAQVPVFVFTPRTEHHHVRLLGYAWPDGDGMSVHVLHRPGSKVTGSLARADALLERANADRYVLVAARVE